MKRNGFTLIELLAVIVILAIIALIATPIVLNIINNAKTSSNERSGELYVKAVENAIMKKQMSGTDTVEDGEYTVQSDGSICIVSNNACTEGTTITIDVEGDAPESGTITVSNGVVTAYTLTVSGTEVKKLASSSGDDDTSTTNEVYENGDYVYFDVKTGEKCSNYHIDNSKTGYNGEVGDNTRKTTDNQTSCLKFYAFNDEGESSSTINLILDHNTTATVKWNSSGINSSGPSEVLEQLKTDTENWYGVDIRNDSYTNEHYGYTVNYSVYRARLITAQEIAKITDADEEINWDESDTSADWYLLDSKDQQTLPSGKSEYAWLFDYTGEIEDGEDPCTNYGCNVADTSTGGYWTVSANSSYANDAFLVSNFGIVGSRRVDPDNVGLRPVITVLKSSLK